MYKIEEVTLKVSFTTAAPLVFMAGQYANLRRTRVLISDLPSVTVTTSHVKENRQFETTVEYWGQLMAWSKFEGMYRAENDRMLRTYQAWTRCDATVFLMRRYNNREAALQGHGLVVQGMCERGMDFTETGLLCFPHTITQFVA